MRAACSAPSCASRPRMRAASLSSVVVCVTSPSKPAAARRLRACQHAGRIWRPGSSESRYRRNPGRRGRWRPGSKGIAQCDGSLRISQQARAIGWTRMKTDPTPLTTGIPAEPKRLSCGSSGRSGSRRCFDPARLTVSRTSRRRCVPTTPHLQKHVVKDIDTGPGQDPGISEAVIWRLADQQEPATWRVSPGVDLVALETSRYSSRRDFLGRLRTVLAECGELLSAGRGPACRIALHRQAGRRGRGQDWQSGSGERPGNPAA